VAEILNLVVSNNDVHQCNNVVTLDVENGNKFYGERKMGEA
jgi:hypothetical protein